MANLFQRLRAAGSSGVELGADEFTPFKDLWQSVAGSYGITTKRMREGMAEREASIIALGQDLDRQLQSAMQFADTDLDRQQIAQAGAQQQRLLQLARSASPEQQAGFINAALQGGASAALEDIESRRETLEQREYDLRAKRGDEYKGYIQDLYDKTRTADTEYNTMMELANELGADNDVVQARFRDMMGISLAESTDPASGTRLRLGPLTLGDEAETKKFTYDEIARGASAWRSGQANIYRDAAGRIIASAEQDGFAADMRDGVVDIRDLNVGGERPGGAQRRAPNESDELTQREASNPMEDVIDLVGGRGAAEYLQGRTTDLIEIASERTGRLGQRAQESMRRSRERIEQLRRRPTND